MNHDLLDDIELAVRNARPRIDLDTYIRTLRIIDNDIEARVSAARASAAHFLAFVKTFHKREFDSVYCEREWRSIASFRFDHKDVAMIVLPTRVNKRSYFKPFVSEKAGGIGLPRNIPIVPWEALVES